MQLLLAVGQRFNEDSFIGGGPQGGGNLGPRTAEQALARIAELKNDQAWTERYLKGGTAEAREMSDLHKIAYGNA